MKITFTVTGTPNMRVKKSNKAYIELFTDHLKYLVDYICEEGDDEHKVYNNAEISREAITGIWLFRITETGQWCVEVEYLGNRQIDIEYEKYDDAKAVKEMISGWRWG